MTQRIFAAGEPRPWAATDASGGASARQRLATLARAALHPRSLLGLMAVLGLLFGFAQVVRQAVHQADAGRRASALLAEATWRCNALKSPSQRKDCLDRYQRELPTDSAGVQGVVSVTTASLR